MRQKQQMDCERTHTAKARVISSWLDLKRNYHVNGLGSEFC